MSARPHDDSMTRYVALLRGINVGGNNKISMPVLAGVFRDAGFEDVSTYINSGNVVFSGPGARKAGSTRMLETLLERAIAESLGMTIPVLVRSQTELAAVVSAAPTGFGRGAEHRWDAMFVKQPRTTEEAFAALPTLAEGVDRAWPGPGVVYFARLDALRTKSRMNRIVGSPIYADLSVRTWGTVTKLLSLL